MAEFTLDFGGSPYGGFGFPSTGGGGTSNIDLGAALDESLQQLGEDVLGAGVDALTSFITSKFNDPGGSPTVINVQPGRVQGLAGLLAYMLQNTPPPDDASRADRGNWVRNAASVVLGIPHDVVWRDETTKRQTYEYFRAYLASFDSITGGKYTLAGFIPPSEPPRYSDSDRARPYSLYKVVQGIGIEGCKAIDSVWNGQKVDGQTVDYWSEQTDDGGNALVDALKGIGESLLGVLTTTATSAVEGAVGGATATSSGAAAGAQTGRAAFFGIPSGLFTIGILALVGYFIFFRRR